MIWNLRKLTRNQGCKFCILQSQEKNRNIPKISWKSTFFTLFFHFIYQEIFWKTRNSWDPRNICIPVKSNKIDLKLTNNNLKRQNAKNDLKSTKIDPKSIRIDMKSTKIDLFSGMQILHSSIPGKKTGIFRKLAENLRFLPYFSIFYTRKYFEKPGIPGIPGTFASL